MVLTFSNSLLSLRNITKDDDECLFRIYASTRTEELAQVTNWTSHQKETFLRSQFVAQHSHYQSNYRGAHFWVIQYRSEIIGRLYLHTHYESSSMRIIDISLLPGWRNRGIGRNILSGIMEYAESLGRTVTIHVECFNPAMRLYKSLGFVLVSQTNGVYHLLEWLPNARAFQDKTVHHQPVNHDNCTATINGI